MKKVNFAMFETKSKRTVISKYAEKNMFLVTTSAYPETYTIEEENVIGTLAERMAQSIENFLVEITETGMLFVSTIRHKSKSYVLNSSIIKKVDLNGINKILLLDNEYSVDCTNKMIILFQIYEKMLLDIIEGKKTKIIREKDNIIFK